MPTVCAPRFRCTWAKAIRKSRNQTSGTPATPTLQIERPCSPSTWQHLAERAGIACPALGSPAHGLLFKRAELAKRALARWPSTEVTLGAEVDRLWAREVLAAEPALADDTLDLQDALEQFHDADIEGAAAEIDPREQRLRVAPVQANTQSPWQSAH
jgi:hypothetical protein